MACGQPATEEMNADASIAEAILETPKELLFRCISCKRVAHYDHLYVDAEDGDDVSPEDKAKTFQEDNQWQCNDCASYRFPLDKIIAWRPSPPTAADKYTNAVRKFNYKENLPREYLVKWATRSYRRLQWVPHMWMVSRQYTKLKNFYEHGPKIPLLEGSIGDLSTYKPRSKAKGSLFATEDEASRAVSVEAEAEQEELRAGAFPSAKPDAEQRIPPLWKTVERVLDVKLRKFSRLKKDQRLVDDEIEHENDASKSEAPEIRKVFDEGEEPDEGMTETVKDFERRARRDIGESDIDRVVWAFIKWDDLPYDQGTSLTICTIIYVNRSYSDLGFTSPLRNDRIRRVQGRLRTIPQRTKGGCEEERRR